MTQRTTKKNVMTHVANHAEYVQSEDFMEQVYERYNGEGEEWECPCCQGEGEVRTTPRRVENRRKSRARKFAAKALRLNRDYRSTLQTSEGSKFDKSLGRPRIISERGLPKLHDFQRRLQTEYDRLNALVASSTVDCPVCAACAAKDEAYADAVSEAIDKLREQDDEYQRSPDNADCFSYMVESYQTSEALDRWFDNHQLGLWGDLPDKLREQIIDEAISACDQVYVSGYSGGFDCTFDSFSVGESEIELDPDEFRETSDALEGCPDRIIAANPETNFDPDGRYYSSVRIYNCNDYDHWSFGLDDEPLAELTLEIIEEPDNCAGMKRRDIESLRDNLREITGEDIDLGGDLAEVWVCYQDSIDGGNCRPGTRAYMAKHSLPLNGHIRAVDMPEQHLREVRKAIRAATLRHRRELAQGYGELRLVSVD